MTVALATGQPVDTVARLLDDDPRTFATLLRYAPAGRPVSRIKVAVEPDLRPLARAVSALGPEFRKAMTDESYRLATLETPRIRVAAARASKQARGMAPSVKAPRSSVATVKAGGRGTFRPKSKKHGKRARFNQILWGSEFGGRPGTGWPARRRSGWWFTPTVVRDAPWIIRQWADAAARVIARAVGG